jgi:hypothetical protein
MDEIDWQEIRWIMDRSIRGLQPSGKQMEQVMKAYRLEPETYKTLHADTKRAVIQELVDFGGDNDRHS